MTEQKENWLELAKKGKICVFCLKPIPENCEVCPNCGRKDSNE